MRFNKAVIVGVGLIGGTFAAALKKKFPRAKIYGMSRTKTTARALLRSGIVAKAFTSPSKEVFEGADMVMIAVPPAQVIRSLKKIARFLDKGTVVVDVSSVRSIITAAAQRICRAHGAHFVGTHPMCGSEKQGFANAHPSILHKSLCVITPTRATNKKALAFVREVFSRVGLLVRYCDAKTHDRLVSQISHLPHILIQALVYFVDRRAIEFSGPSFKELSRIASSPCALWLEIYKLNARILARDVRRYCALLGKVACALERNQFRGLARLCAQAKSKRDTYVP